MKTSWLPVVPQAGAWRAPQMPSSHWGRMTRSVVAPEAAVLWFEPTEENPGCSSGIAHQPKGDRHTQIKNTHTDSSISSGLRVEVNVCEDIKESKWIEAIRRYGLLVYPLQSTDVLYQQWYKHIRKSSADTGTPAGTTKHLLKGSSVIVATIFPHPC